jgi:hypothetical protein
MTARYQLKDDGYANFRWIMRGRERVGRVTKSADGAFVIGIIGRVQATGTTWEDAKNQVVAAVEGISLADLTSDLVHVRPVQERTQAIITWLTNNAIANGGRLIFSNADLAHAAGWARPNQALGNLVSRLDLCCARLGLPAIGCAAAATFPNAWRRPGANRIQRDWDWPVELMQRRAKAHRWTLSDFERINRESRALLVGTAHIAWDDFMAKHEARVKAWAYAPA